jgi:hypothetical protein
MEYVKREKISTPSLTRRDSHPLDDKQDRTGSAVFISPDRPYLIASLNNTLM